MNNNLRKKALGSSIVDQREFGRLEGRVDAIEKNTMRIEATLNDQLKKQEIKIDTMTEQLSGIQTSLNSMSNKAEGSKKTVLFLVAVVAGASAALTWTLDTLKAFGRF